jgi:hypothetical protein
MAVLSALHARARQRGRAVRFEGLMDAVAPQLGQEGYQFRVLTKSMFKVHRGWLRAICTNPSSDKMRKKLSRIVSGS